MRLALSLADRAGDTATRAKCNIIDLSNRAGDAATRAKCNIMDLPNRAGDAATRAKGSSICNNRRYGSKCENSGKKRKTRKCRRIQRRLRGAGSAAVSVSAGCIYAKYFL
jgi:hypothetical protein